MVINIYYGGRGIIEDPTLSVLKKIENVLDELRVTVNRYNLYDLKNSITTLPQTLKEADGIILAASVEWNGVGGYLHSFLDACWLYGDKEKISQTYMTPVVISTTYGEKEGSLELAKAWEILGGKVSPGITAYVDDYIDFECNTAYTEYIEKQAENIYRNVSKHTTLLPSSSYALKKNLISSGPNLTPQEGEQLSKYVSDDIYVKQQKEDIEELASFFKGLMGDSSSEYEEIFKDKFSPLGNFSATYLFILDNAKDSIFINIENRNLTIDHSQNADADVVAKMSSSTLDNILHGRMTFQRAFMTGEITAKGDIKTLQMLDSLFAF